MIYFHVLILILSIPFVAYGHVEISRQIAVRLVRYKPNARCEIIPANAVAIYVGSWVTNTLQFEEISLSVIGVFVFSGCIQVSNALIISYRVHKNINCDFSKKKFGVLKEPVIFLSMYLYQFVFSETLANLIDSREKSKACVEFSSFFRYEFLKTDKAVRQMQILIILMWFFTIICALKAAQIAYKISEKMLRGSSHVNVQYVSTSQLEESESSNLNIVDIFDGSTNELNNNIELDLSKQGTECSGILE